MNIRNGLSEIRQSKKGKSYGNHHKKRVWTLGEAIAVCKLYPNKTMGYYVYDTHTKRICYIARPVKWKIIYRVLTKIA